MGGRLTYYLKHRATGWVLCAFNHRDEAESICNFLNYMTGKKQTFGLYRAETGPRNDKGPIKKVPACSHVKDGVCWQCLYNAPPVNQDVAVELVEDDGTCPTCHSELPKGKRSRR